MEYLLKLPGKPDKKVTNIVPEILRPQVEKIGGTLEPISEKETVMA